jgi:hypothetical protein
MGNQKIFIAQARNHGEWFDLTYPTYLENARWFINGELIMLHRIPVWHDSFKERSKCWDAFRLKIAK